MRLPDSKGKSKANKEKKYLRMDIIAPLFKRGWSYRALRNEVMARLDLKTYSLRTVKLDVDELLKEWRETRIENIDYALQLELERIDDLIREAWEAWEKSKEDYQKGKGTQFAIPSESSTDSESSVVVTHMQQSKEDIRSCGDPRYLELINKLLSERRKLLGLYAPEKRDVIELRKDIVSEMTDEELDKEIQRLRSLNDRL